MSQILCEKLIFQSIVDQVFCRDTLIEQGLHLIDHPLLQSFPEPPGDLLPTQVTVDIDTYDETIHRRQLTPGCGVLQVVSLYLDRTDGALARIDIGRIMHVRAIPDFQFREHLRQLRQRFPFETIAQLLVLRHGRQFITFQHRLDIESRSPTEDWLLPPPADILIHIVEILLILEQVVLRTRLPNVDQMIRDPMPVHHIVGQIFTRADIHATIHLTGISRDHLPADLRCQSGCYRGLPRCRRTQYRYHPMHSVCKNSKKKPSDKIGRQIF